MDAKRFRESADEIEAEGYLGWGSAMNDAADTIVALQSKNAAMRGAIKERCESSHCGCRLKYCHNMKKRQKLYCLCTHSLKPPSPNRPAWC